MNDRQRFLVASSALVGCILLFACSSSGGGGTVEQAQEPEPQASATEVEPRIVELSDGEDLVLIAGMVPNTRPSRVGFAVEGDEPTSPGPTIRVRKGETVTIALINDHYLPDGRPFGVPHNIAVVVDKDIVWTEQVPLWGAHVGGFGDPNLSEGDRSSVTFTAEDAGSFYYVCANLDHVERGMWGQFIVEE